MTNPKHTDTSRSGDLVERLRDAVKGPYDLKFVTGELLCASADRIEALSADNEQLRSILEQWLNTAREHLDTEVAGHTFEALRKNSHD